MKAMRELRELSIEDLNSKLKDLEKEKFLLNAGRASGTAQQEVAKFGNIKKNIARVKTLLREEEIRVAKENFTVKKSNNLKSKKSEGKKVAESKNQKGD